MSTIALTDGADEFREAVAFWASERVPSAVARQAELAVPSFEREWLRELHEAGLAAPHWARRWGGSELDVAHQVALYEALSTAGAPGVPMFFVALNHVYATLTTWGTEAQCDQFLPSILRGEDVWCQGFSEPEAGSDLANVRTRAVRDGDHYVVTGQKVWSSRANLAQWCLLLVRTDAAAPKHRGLTMLLLDLSLPGVEVRTIRQATGDAEFCEIFLDDVEIPVALRVGSENDGWRICQTTLSAERGPTLLELSSGLGEALAKVEGLAVERHAALGAGMPEALLRDRIARLRCEVISVQLLCRKVVEEMANGRAAGAQAGVIKIAFSELQQKIAAFGVELAGLPGQFDSSQWMSEFVASWAWLIGGGTNDVLRNVISERVLGMPRWTGAKAGAGA